MDRRNLLGLLGAGVIAAGLVLAANLSPGAREATLVPPPSDEPPASTAASAVAVFAGGCFWGIQGVFQHVKGVTSAVSGYAGGDKATAEYQTVSGGRTGHAEAVKITYDPRIISYGRLMQIYFSVVHDPTQLNRQGPDVGTQYRSAIFPADEEQARMARAYIAQLSEAHVYPAAIVTRIENGSFYPAENYHQDYLTENPRSPYIVMHDMPKIAALKNFFPEIYREQPALVKTASR